jgi:hypothetical protein
LGVRSGAASRLAAEVFASARNGGTMPIRTLLDRITSLGENR